MLASVLLSLSASASSYGVVDLGLEADPSGAVFLSDRGNVAGSLRAPGGDAVPSLWRRGRRIGIVGVRRIAGMNARDQLAVDTADGPGVWEAGKGVRLAPRTDPGGMAATIPHALGIDDVGNLAVVHAPSGSAGGNSRVVTWPKASRIPETFPPVAFSPDGRVLAEAGGDGRRPGTRTDAALYDERSFQTIGGEGLRIEPLGVARGGWVCGALSAQAVVGDREAGGSGWAGGATTGLGGGRRRPFLWHEGRFVSPFWAGEGRAVGVNEWGQAVGEADGVSVLFDGGTARKLDTFLPPGARYRVVRALAINAKGQILVEAERTGGSSPRTILLLTPKGRAKVLPIVVAHNVPGP